MSIASIGGIIAAGIAILVIAISSGKKKNLKVNKIIRRAGESGT